MAYYNDGKTFRNLPEQVDKNKNDIEEMQSTVETDEKNINDNMNKILAHDTRINALETTKLSASDNSIKLTRSNAEMGSVSIAKVGGNTLVNGNDIPLATINGESIMQDKDFTIDSNLSDLLWANLGIGRWANQTFVSLVWQPLNISDSLLPYYKSCVRTFAYVNFNQDSITMNESFGDNISLNYCFYHFNGANNGTLILKNRIDTRQSWIYNVTHTFAYTNLKEILVADDCQFDLSGRVLQTFYGSTNLVHVGKFNISKAVEIVGIFNYCPNLKRVEIQHWTQSFGISDSTAFETADLVEILNNLDPVSTTQTLTMGSTNLAKLSSSDILIATGKGWQLA